MEWLLPMFVILAGVLIEVFYKPRIDITDVGDVLLWYNDILNDRDYIYLFNIKRN